MRGAGYEDVLLVLQVPGNKADAVPCERLRDMICLRSQFIDFPVPYPGHLQPPRPGAESGDGHSP